MGKEEKSKDIKEHKEEESTEERRDRSCCYMVDPCGCYVDPCCCSPNIAFCC